nr:MAG TPA: hypothetical protein [Caudoviricetes sp.]
MRIISIRRLTNAAVLFRGDKTVVYNCIYSNDHKTQGFVIS